MARNGKTGSFVAEAAILPARIVKAGVGNGVQTAASSSDKVFGISTEVDAALGERVDVVLEGTADLKLGGTIARGDFLVADSQGRGVTASPAAGANAQVTVMALTSGVTGDLIEVLVNPVMLQG